eukprot:Lithocolla_globosa_v1_NODE_253_length_4814_cov_57.763606.p3 type:complete len:126 gc:universal NODE_253_length_4814_cov_57.763606:1068-1445(+)
MGIIVTTCSVFPSRSCFARRCMGRQPSSAGKFPSVLPTSLRRCDSTGIHILGCGRNPLPAGRYFLNLPRPGLTLLCLHPRLRKRGSCTPVVGLRGTFGVLSGLQKRDPKPPLPLGTWGSGQGRSH